MNDETGAASRARPRRRSRRIAVAVATVLVATSAAAVAIRLLAEPPPACGAETAPTTVEATSIATSWRHPCWPPHFPPGTATTTPAPAGSTHGRRP